MSSISSNAAAVTADADGPSLLVRWVVLFTGSTMTADYEPTGSTGESPELVREVSNLCVQFHPHSEIRLFPRDREVYLYWRARATGDHVVTQVSTAPNPDGVRVALEYVSLLFDAKTFAQIGGNPFQVRALQLPAQVREAFLAQKREPLLIAAPKLAENNPATGAVTLPENNALAGPESVQALEDYFAGGGAGTEPPTFATWWTSRGYVPENTFQIVLRAGALQALPLREATQIASELAQGIKSALPSVSDNDAVVTGLIGSLLTNSDAIVSIISAAAERVNSEGPEQFRERLSGASRKAAQVSSDLTSLQKRLGSSSSATRLAEIAAQYVGLSQEVLTIRHPNPFGARTPSPAAALSAALSSGASAAKPVSSDSRGGSNGQAANGARTSAASEVGPGAAKKSNGVLIGAGAAGAAALIAALAAFNRAPQQTPANRKNPAKNSSVASVPKPATATPAAPASAAPVATRPAAPAKPAAAAPANPTAVLNRYANDILPIAAVKARSAATVAATDRGRVPGEEELRSITMKAIRDAYQQTLPAADFARAFGNSSWTYPRYQQTFTALLPAVRRAARSGASEAVAQIEARRRAVAEAARVREAARTPEPPRRTRRVAEQEPVQRPRRVERTPAPRRTPDVVRATPRPTDDGNSGTGSAASSGL